MKHLKRSILTLFFLGILLPTIAQQHELRLLNGKVKSTKKIEIDNTLKQIFYRTEKGRLKTLDFDEVYSLAYSDSVTQYFYAPKTDTDELTLAQMNDFLTGSSDALQQKKPWGYFAGGVGFGVGSVFLMPALGLPTMSSPVLTVVAGAGATKIPLKTKNITNTELLANPNYMKGYQEAAKKRRNKYTFLGLGIGLTASLLLNLSVR